MSSEITSQEKIEAIRQKCIKANQEIETTDELVIWNENEKSIKRPRSIRIADILLAMQGTISKAIGIDMNGFFLDCDDDMNNITISEESWDLRQDSLNAQSPETIDYLYSLFYS